MQRSPFHSSIPNQSHEWDSLAGPRSTVMAQYPKKTQGYRGQRPRNDERRSNGSVAKRNGV